MRRAIPLAGLVAAVVLTLISMVRTGAAATSIDTLSFKPATDQGLYLVTQQSQTLGKWGYAFGLWTEYSKGSIAAVSATGAKLWDVIDQQLAMQLGGALGVMDWLNIGLNVSTVPYQQFNTVAAGTPDNGARMGDIRLDLKARLLDTRKYPVGLALVPFITFPTGNDEHFVGSGSVTGGGVLVVETPRYADRFSLALNVGGQAEGSETLSSGTKTGSRFLVGTAFNVAVIKPLEVIGELNGWTLFSDFWEKNARNLEFNGALRWQTPLKGFAVTAGGGTGILNAMGAPDYRAFLGLSYRKTKLEPKQKPATEVVIRTNRIHFEFNKARILPESQPILDQVASTILSQPEIRHVTVEGHTDGLGGAKYNEKLSLRRAKAVVDYLVKKGISADMLSAVGKGEAEPIADNKTKAGRAQNRRIEFHLEIPPDAKVRVEKGDDAPVFMRK